MTFKGNSYPVTSSKIGSWTFMLHVLTLHDDFSRHTCYKISLKNWWNGKVFPVKLIKHDIFELNRYTQCKLKIVNH